MRRWMAVAAAVAGASTASAAPCGEAYTSDALLTDLGAIEVALRDGDDSTALFSAKQLEIGLECLDEVLPSAIAARTYRALGGGYHASGRLAVGKSWLRTAAKLDPGFQYGVRELPQDSRLPDAWAAAVAASGSAARPCP